ncbi:MAG: SgcJ/EcaC family oxidoreductase [Gammaproteobacteria bacterium]
MKTCMYSVLLMMSVALIPSLCAAKAGVEPTKADIAGQFAIWNNALKTGKAEQVAALYCENGGVLIPTVSNKIRTNRTEIADYFDHFLLLKPSGQIDQSFIRVLSPDIAIRAGIYTFQVTDKGKPGTVKARYTFVYAKEHGHWCIMEQHSSAMPESDVGPTSSH